MLIPAAQVRIMETRSLPERSFRRHSLLPEFFIFFSPSPLSLLLRFFLSIYLQYYFYFIFLL